MGEQELMSPISTYFTVRKGAVHDSGYVKAHMISLQQAVVISSLVTKTYPCLKLVIFPLVIQDKQL